MKVPQIAPLAGMTPLGIGNTLSQDQAALARRKAAQPLLAAKPQAPCNVGLFSDEAAQIDLIEISRVQS